MYKLLIVDDEELVRRSVIRIVDWKALGFNEVLEAENGREALDKALVHKPDLVLADIRMPFMDGLELARELREKLPSTFMVILSGHDEFKLAQQAIGLGVLDYILKPLGATSLTKKMQEIRHKLDEKLKEKQYLLKIRSQLHQSLPLLRESYLNSIVCTPGHKSMDEGRLRFLEIPLIKGPYCVCIIEPDLEQVSSEDYETYCFAMKNIAMESIGSSHPVFSDNKGRIVIIFCISEFPQYSGWKFMLNDILTVIQKSIDIFLDKSATFAAGTTVDNLSGLYISFSDALSALECKYTLGKGRIYNIYDLDYRDTEFIYPFDSFSEIMLSIKSNHTSSIDEGIKKLISELKERKASPPNIKLVFVQLTTELLKLITEISSPSSPVSATESIWSAGLSLYSFMEKLRTVDEIASVVSGFAVKVSRHLADMRTNSSRLLVSKAREYVDANYQLEDLSLYTTSTYISVSAGYLSALFKKETGTNFTDYLTKVRMEKAMSLLRTTDMKTYEVAYATGFSNPHYFSIAFKKYVGRTPSEYKEIPGE